MCACSQKLVCLRPAESCTWLTQDNGDNVPLCKYHVHYLRVSEMRIRPLDRSEWLSLTSPWRVDVLS